MELMITVSIIALLASMAIPSYRKAVERTYQREAEDLLQTIYAGERAYFFVNAKYYQPVATTDWTNIYMDNPNLSPTIPITFSVTSATASVFTAQALRNNDGSPCAGKIRTIDEGRNLGGNWIVGGCPIL